MGGDTHSANFGYYQRGVCKCQDMYLFIFGGNTDKDQEGNKNDATSKVQNEQRDREGQFAYWQQYGRLCCRDQNSCLVFVVVCLWARCVFGRVWESCGRVCKVVKKRTECVESGIYLQFFSWGGETLPMMGVCVFFFSKQGGIRWIRSLAWSPSLAISPSWWRGNSGDTLGDKGEEPGQRAARPN